MSFTWLITGASGGLGAALAMHVLRAGHGVIATARNVEKAAMNNPDIEKQGGHWLQLDVTQPNTEDIVRKVVEEKGVNVIVNNAGFGARGFLEDFTLKEIQTQFETNFLGAVAVMKGAIPNFRQRRSGNIVNISSTAGVAGNPGSSVYSASKFALEGLSEALAMELSDFNIRVLIVQPGGFRTNFQGAVMRPEKGRLSEVYHGTTANKMMDKLEEGHGKQPGDPDKAAQAIIDVVTGQGQGKDVLGLMRLPLGNDAVDKWRATLKDLTKNVDETEGIARSAVYVD